jgi:hypothetical protein
VVIRRVLAAATLAIVATALPARVATAHPLHTTLAQFSYDARSGLLEGSIRVFAGDFAAAVAKRSGAAAPSDDRVTDAAAYAYLTAALRLTSAQGRAVPLTWCGSRRTGDVLWLCVRAAAAPDTLRLSDQILCELFDDQVNIVQTAAGGRKASALFTKGDGAKTLL